jgi:hypothetical protein
MSKQANQDSYPFRITGGINKIKRWTSITEATCPQDEPTSFKEIVYDNRVLHIRKKFTIPTEPHHYTPKR